MSELRDFRFVENPDHSTSDTRLVLKALAAWYCEPFWMAPLISDERGSSLLLRSSRNLHIRNPLSELVRETLSGNPGATKGHKTDVVAHVDTVAEGTVHRLSTRSSAAFERSLNDTQLRPIHVLSATKTYEVNVGEAIGLVLGSAALSGYPYFVLNRIADRTHRVVEGDGEVRLISLPALLPHRLGRQERAAVVESNLVAVALPLYPLTLMFLPELAGRLLALDLSLREYFALLENKTFISSREISSARKAQLKLTLARRSVQRGSGMGALDRLLVRLLKFGFQVAKNRPHLVDRYFQRAHQLISSAFNRLRRPAHINPLLTSKDIQWLTQGAS